MHRRGSGRTVPDRAQGQDLKVRLDDQGAAGAVIAAFVGGIILVQKALKYFAARRETARLAVLQAQPRTEAPQAAVSGRIQKIAENITSAISLEASSAKIPAEKIEAAAKAVAMAKAGMLREGVEVEIAINGLGTFTVKGREAQY